MSRVVCPPVRVKREVIERDGGCCLLALPGCLVEAGTVDHRANRGMGGSPVLNDPVNLIAACAICNGVKADAGVIVLADLAERGLYIRRAATVEGTLERARLTPVEYLDGERFFLIDARTRTHITEMEAV